MTLELVEYCSIGVQYIDQYTTPVRVGQVEADVDGATSSESGYHGVVPWVGYSAGSSCPHVIQEVVAGLPRWREGQADVPEAELCSHETYQDS